MFLRTNKFFFIWYSLSIFWSVNKIYTLQYLFYIVCGAGLVICMVETINSEKKLIRAVKLASIVFCIEIFFSLLESVTSFRLPVSPFSDIVGIFGREQSLQLSLDSFAIPSVIQPPTGFQWNPNDLAITMALLIPFFLFQERALFKWVGIISLCIVILMTSSRTVVLAIGLLFLIYL